MITKSTANYIAAASRDYCRDCTMFRKPSACTLVSGVINLNGHCDYFERKQRLPVRDRNASKT